MATPKVTIGTLNFQTGTSLTAYTTWTFSGASASYVQEYKVIWEFDSGNGVWFVGSDSSSSVRQSTYSVPSNAKKIRVRVRAIAKTHKVGNTDTPYFTCKWSANKKLAVPSWYTDRPIPTPSAPTVEIVGKAIVAVLDNISTDQAPTNVQFQFIRNDLARKGYYTNVLASIRTRHAEAQINIVAQSEYKVRARCYKKVNNKYVYSDWSDYSESLTAPEMQAPPAPTVEVNGAVIKMSLNVYNDLTPTSVQFEIVSGSSTLATPTVTIVKNAASTTYNGTYDKTYKIRARYYNGNTVVKYGAWSEYSEEVTITQEALQVPPVPTLAIKNGKLTASLSIYFTSTILANQPTSIFFEAVANNSPSNSLTAQSNISTNYASATWNVTPGFEYKARACCKTADGRTSSWTEYSSPVSTGPANITGAVTAVADSETAVTLTWAPATNATSYEVQYTDTEKYFDTSPDNVKSMTVEGVTTAIVTGLDTGKLWYFRVRAVNDQGSSGWTKPVSCRIGTTPTAPTTWSYTSTVTIGQEIILNWVHNDEDESAQAKAQVRLTINGTVSTHDVSGDTSVFRIATGDYHDGTIIYWEVRTWGAMPDKPSPWSTRRQVTIYAPATVNVKLFTSSNWLWDPFEFAVDTIYSAKGEGYDELVDDILYHLPLYATVTAYPDTQKVVSMNVSIIANEAYDTVDTFGNDMHVQKGTEVYSKRFSSIENNVLHLNISAGDVALESNMSYTVKATVAMDSGLSGEGSAEFLVAWDSDFVEPDATVAIDFNTYTAYIHPFCDNGFTDALLSVYRREYDGTFTPIAVNIDADDDTTVVDPHPSLDFARYRVTALSKVNGLLSYYDLPAEEVGCSSIIIQWNEAWTPFDVYDYGIPTDTPPYSGSMLVLPYNVDVQNDVKRDVALVNYIGRSNPVSYYGTQRGETAQWSSDIPADDRETLYQIRRLASYEGDVYVREPSGTGYWANVTVSYKLEHTKTIVPVSIAINRVDGGM